MQFSRYTMLLILASAASANAKFDPIAFTISLNTHHNYTDVTTLSYPEDLLKDPKLKLAEAKDVRWLSHDKATTTLRKCLPSIYASLKRVAEERNDARAAGLAVFTLDYRFVLSVHMMCDVLPHMTSLSLVMQRRDVVYSTIKPLVNGTIAIISRMKEFRGEHYKGAEAKVKELHDQNYNIRLPTSSDLTKFHEKVYLPFLTNIIQNLEDRFPDLPFIEKFGVFSYMYMNTSTVPDDQNDHGNQEIKIITSHMRRNEISNGIFTCTEGGIFKCQVYSMAFQNGTTFLDIWHNDIVVASLYGHIKNGYATGGNVVVLSLAEGDTVQVKTRVNKIVSLFGSELYNTFTCSQVGSESLSQNKSSIPAFSVISDRNQKVTGGDSVMYNITLVDTTNVFDSNSGFSAPSSGIYIFHFFGLPMQNEELWHEMFVNDNYICSARSQTSFEWAAAGNTVILHLHKNETVSIKARAGTDSYLFGNPDQRFTSFSGVQIITDQDSQSPDIHPVVAFSVGLAKNLTAKQNQNVTFDRVFTNYGNAFNLSSGLFVAPVTGVYEFSYHFRGRVLGKAIYLHLLHNRRILGGIYGQGSGVYSTASNSAVLNIIGGDVVRITDFGNSSLYGDPSEIYCTFSGYLLHAVSPAEIVVGK